MTYGTSRYAMAHIKKQDPRSLQRQLAKLKAGHLASRFGVRGVSSPTDIRLLRIDRKSPFYVGAVIHSAREQGLVQAHFGMLVAFTQDVPNYRTLIERAPELKAYDQIVFLNPTTENGGAYPAFLYKKSSPEAAPTPLSLAEREDMPKDAAICGIAYEPALCY